MTIKQVKAGIIGAILGIIALAIIGASVYSSLLKLVRVMLHTETYLVQTIESQQKDIYYIRSLFEKTAVEVTNLEKNVDFNFVRGVANTRKINENKKVKPTYEFLKQSTVILDTIVNGESYSRGTGTVVKETTGYTYIMTNKHVCDSTTDICVVADEKDNQIELEFVKESQAVDLSLWRVQGTLENKVPIKGFGTIDVQEAVYIAGNYYGAPFIYGEGVCAGKFRDDLFLQLPGFHGDSGSGVFNSNGELVGVLYAANLAPITVNILGQIMQTPMMLYDITTHVRCVEIEQVKLFLSGVIDL